MLTLITGKEFLIVSKRQNGFYCYCNVIEFL